MLDLETLATDSHAMILSIGACEFDIGKPLVDNRTFYRAVRQDLQVEKWKRTRDPRTEKWWSEQSEAARFVFNDPFAVKLDSALIDFTMWLNGKSVEMWGNGSDFDNVILANAYWAMNMSTPWSYAKNRCYRTLKALGIPLGNGQGKEREGTHHNALDDAIYQAHYASVWLARIQKGA